MSFSRLRLLTSGESHGPELVAILEGLPSGLQIDSKAIDTELSRRQHGHGRGGRMKIESDQASLVTGIRAGRTLGSPVAIRIPNRDHSNWAGIMSPFGRDPDATEKRRISAPRPGHADLAGGQKWNTRDLRDILERASARETAARVGAGALTRQLLATFGVEIRSGVRSLGPVGPSFDDELDLGFEQLPSGDRLSPLRMIDSQLEQQAVALVDDVFRRGDTLGGSIVVAARGLPPGLGSCFHWDRRLDGRLAQAMMSIPAVKAVAVGDGISASRRPGSDVHDPIRWSEDQGYQRSSNRAGGLEGGVSTGEEILLQLMMKPISTLRRGLPSVDIDSRTEHLSNYERSDVTAVPACGVVAEAMLSLVLADAILEKAGGDSMEEVARNLAGFCKQVRDW